MAKLTTAAWGDGEIDNSGNGALTILDISSNSIPNDQQTNLKSICNRKNINLKL